MPDLIDKSNCIAWLAMVENRCLNERTQRYVEYLSLHGVDSVSTLHLINSLGYEKDVVWLCVEKTKTRQLTRSFEVYIMPTNFIENRVTTILSAVCRVDKDGMVKVNYWHELEHAIKYIDPYATIRRF